MLKSGRFLIAALVSFAAGKRSPLKWFFGSIWTFSCIAMGGFVLSWLFMAAAPAKAATRYEAGIAAGASLIWMNDTDLNDRLTNIRDLGATWMRVDFSWPAIQPNNSNEYNWDPYDRVVREADKHQLKILAMLAYSPAWAREPQCAALAVDEEAAQKCSPRSSEEFGRFAGAAALHYKGQNVRAWEIWNEPNLSGYWKTIQPDGTLFVDPEAYAGLANAAALQIHYHYPDSVIVTGGLAPMFEPKYSRGMRQSDYLARLLPHLQSDLFDGIGVHPYTWPVLPSKNAIYNAFYTVDNGNAEYNLRTILAADGWGDKEIWGTEYGASTKGVRSMSHPTKSGRPDHVSEAMQAQIVKQGIEDWYEKSNVGPLFVHSDSDQWLFADKNEGGFGLRREDGTKKPAYDMFQSAAQQLDKQ